MSLRLVWLLPHPICSLSCHTTQNSHNWQNSTCDFPRMICIIEPKRFRSSIASSNSIRHQIKFQIRGNGLNLMHMRIIVPPAGHVCHVFSAANSYRPTVMRGQEFFVSTFKLFKVAVHISYIFNLIGISGLNDCTRTTLRSLLGKFRGSSVDILKFSSHAQVRSPKITSEEVLDKAFLRSASI